MKRIISLATVLTFVLGIAVSGFAAAKTNVKTPTVRNEMSKEKAVKKLQKHRRHRRWHRRKRHHHK